MLTSKNWFTIGLRRDKEKVYLSKNRIKAISSSKIDHMTKFSTVLLLISIYLFTTACTKGTPAFTSNPDVWLIPKLEVYAGAGRDGIASINEPQFTTTAATGFMDEEDLVTVLQIGDEIKAYPHPILDYHEIVNDEIDNLPVAINYCPFTGTSMAWERTFDGLTTTFGVSGLLYNSNLMPFDRATETIWSQLALKGVNGELLGKSAIVHPMIEMPWKTWKNLFPTGKVLSKNTGFDLVYGDYPYLDFRTNNDFFVFPVTNNDNRLPNKERVLGIIGTNETRIFRFNSFTEKEKIQVIHDFFMGSKIVIFGSAAQGIMGALSAKLADGTPLEFLPTVNEHNLLVDTNGNEWTILGKAVSGELKGTQLDLPKSFMGYWFSFAIFYPNVDIY